MTTARSALLLHDYRMAGFCVRRCCARRDDRPRQGLSIDRPRTKRRLPSWIRWRRSPAPAELRRGARVPVTLPDCPRARTEARDAIASMVNADPFYQLSQASPRVRTMFKDVRQSLLPTIAQQAYADAKAAFDRKDPNPVHSSSACSHC